MNTYPAQARLRVTVAIVLFALLSGSLAAASEDPVEPPALDWSQGTSSALEDTFLIKNKNFGRTAAEVVGVNLLVWSFDYYIRPDGNDGFRVGFRSWQENLKNGFEWDDNNFNTNQFAHPYHGSLYFNAARSNGYSFWEAVPFTFGGSYLWEFFGETHHPSMNDWIATSVGGAALGEMIHRFGRMIRDNGAAGGRRNTQEVAGFLVDPMGGLNRIIDGDWGRLHENHPERFAKNYSSRLDLGFRTVGEDKLGDTDTTRVFMEFDFDYGDPFYGDMGSPYDHFNLELQLNFSDVSTIGRVQSVGLLGGMFLKDTEDQAHILGAFHHFDFMNNSKLEWGAQTVGAGLLSRWENVLGATLRTEAHVGGIILGASSSDYASFSGRSYDYGPGLQISLQGELIRDGFRYVHLSHQQNFIRAVNGNNADHFISMTRLKLGLPLYQNIGLGVEYNLVLSERKYELYEDVSTRNPQTRLYIAWALN